MFTGTYTDKSTKAFRVKGEIQSTFTICLMQSQCFYFIREILQWASSATVIFPKQTILQSPNQISNCTETFRRKTLSEMKPIVN